jgi:hypothetical protein
LSPTPTPSDTAPAAAPDRAGQEFRPYRRFVSLLALGIIFVGSSYLLISVGVTIYRQRHAVASGTPVGAPMSPGDLRGCQQELSDVTASLQKHLENSHYVLGGYDQQEAQRWSDEGTYWRNQWKLLGERCHLDRPAPAGAPKAMDEMVGAYRDLEETAVVYTKELLRFGREQAPRLDRVRQRIDRIGKRLERQGARPGDENP